MGVVKACLLSWLTMIYIVGIMDSMKAQLIVRERYTHKAGGFAEVVIWQVPQPVPPCAHSFKYRLVYIVNGFRVVGFDNERGKGDHYADFDATVDRWNDGYRNP